MKLIYSTLSQELEENEGAFDIARGHVAAIIGMVNGTPIST